MQDYPIHSVLDELKHCLNQYHRLILQASPGAGKTTIVPLALLDQPWLNGKQIIILEPRRLATRSAAARMADLLVEEVGQTVGYQIRQDKKISHKTRILVVTEGILTRKLQADPELSGVGLVIFDEFHERSLHADLSLAFCLQSQEILNNRMKILIMSATLNTQALSDKLNTDDFKAPSLCSKGRSYPVDIIYRKAHLPAIDYKNLLSAVVQQTLNALSEQPGNILVFLPGAGEITRLAQLLSGQLSDDKNIIIAPLYGDLTKAEQDQAIAPTAKGIRKIVLATNIAQTSLTIEGINIVIDSGLQRQSHFDPDSGMSGLHTLKIAQDSAAQRSGRAGRLGPGLSYRLWTESQQKHLSKHETPEILNSDLAPVILELAQWGVVNMEELIWLDLPSQGHIAQAKELLRGLQAIDHLDAITSHGKKILALGLHPRLAHMILTAQHYTADTFNPVETASLVAAVLTEKDIFLKRHVGAHVGDSADRDYDIVNRILLLKNLNNNSHSQHHINKHQVHRVRKTSRDYQRRLNSIVAKITADKSLAMISETEFIGILVAHAYPDRIAQLRNNTAQRYLLCNGKGAYFNQPDPLSSKTYLAIASLNSSTAQAQKEARIFLATALDKAHIEEFFSHLIQQQSRVLWNNEQQKVEVLSLRTLGAIILDKKIETHIEPEKVFPVLLNAVKNMGLDCLNESKTALNLRQRIQFINTQKQSNKNCPHILAAIDLPDLSDDYLISQPEQWLLPHLTNEKSIKQLQKLDLYNIFSALLSWEQLQQLEQLAPEKLTVPSGSNIRIDYSDPQNPVLAVRLQELFGLQQTPAILNGCFALLLHLLSPASRPMQVTQDLASFWKNTYNEVKKELRGKYKKHYWPDNPLQAQATSRAKPRKH